MTTDRHGITVLDVHDCWDLLRQADVGRLAVTLHDETEIFPINFVVDRDTVVFRSAQGTKLVGAIEGRTVAFEADGYDPEAGEAWSVIIKGRATEIERNHELFEVMHLPLFPWHAGPKRSSSMPTRTTSAPADSNGAETNGFAGNKPTPKIHPRNMAIPPTTGTSP